MQIDLETARLILRRFTPEDAELLVALDDDPAVMRWLTGGAATPRETIEGKILPAFVASGADGAGYGVWAAHERASGDFVGWFSLRRKADAADTATLGYRLRRAAWGRGLATEGARTVIGRGFADGGLGRVLASTYEENRGSRRVMEKLGLTFVRGYRFTDEDMASQETVAKAEAKPWDGDEVEYALTREAWERMEMG